MASEELKELRDVIKDWQRFIKQAAALLGCYDTTTDVMEAIGRLNAARQSAFDAGLEAGATIIRGLACDPNYSGHWRNGFEQAQIAALEAIRSRIGQQNKKSGE